MDNSHGEDDDHRGLNDPDERHEGMGLMPPGTGDFAPLPPPPGMMPPPLMPPGMQGMPPPPPGMGHPPGMPPPPGMGMPPPHHMPGPPPGMPHPPGQGPPRPGLLPTPQGMHGMPPPPGQGPPPSMTLPPPPPGQGPPPGMPPPGQGMMPPPSGQGPPHGMPPPHPSMSIPPPGQGPPPGMPPPPPGQGPPPGMPPPPPGQGPPPGMPPPPLGQGPPPGMPPPPGQGPPPGMPPPPGQGPPPGMPPPGQGPPPGMPHPPGQGPPPGMPPPPPGQGPPPGMPPPPPGQGPPPGMPPPGQGPPPNMPSGLPPNIPPPNQPMHPPGPPPGMPPQMGQGPPPGMPPPLGQPLPPSQQDMSKMPPRSEPLSDISLRPPGSDPEDRPNREEKEDRPESREREREPREKPNRLPQALEKALAFKSRRAFELGFDESDLDGTTVVEEDDTSKGLQVQSALEDLEEYEDDDDKDEPQEKKRNKRTKSRKKKKRKSRAQRQLEASSNTSSDKENKSKSDKASDKPLKVEIEYVQEKLSMFELEPQYRSYAKIFEVFRMTENVPAVKLEDSLLADIAGLAKKAELSKVPKLPEEDDMDENDKAESKAKLSKRKMKKMTRLSIAELKQLVSRPDVVEMHDVTARDPKLLVQLKAHRNTVPVPRHWCFKRKYLQGKRGIEKPPFDLPDFIKKTGIMEMRSALQDKEETKTLKAKMRERARPKMGKIDIDYQKLHDAFFKWQTKPRLTIHGDLYYEGKEYETRLKEKKPGELSSELRVALGMPVGAGAHKVPPPWLIAMQRYGPPPSYPNLRIPGLNCPIPEGASFGYHAGGWGKPPVDETGKPLYGDVFATAIPHSELAGEEEEVEKNTWGELESESEEESSDSEGEGEGEDESGLTTPGPEGLATPSGIATVPSGIETPDIIELRKKKIEADMDGGDTPALYQVVPEKRVERVGNAMMGSTHVYDLGASSGTASVGGTTSVTSRKDTVEVALDPSELDMDTDAMAARYEQQIKEQQSHLQKEDLSDMLADHVNRQKNKRKKQQQTQENKPSKKYKEFKF